MVGGVGSNTCILLRILANYQQERMMAKRAVKMDLQSYLSRVHDLPIWSNMLLAKTPILLQQSREVKGLSEITSELMAVSRLELKCPCTQSEWFSMIAFSASHPLISTLCIYHLSVYPTSLCLHTIFLYPSNLAMQCLLSSIHVCSPNCEEKRRHLFPFLELMKERDRK